jgi:hypothetical protein
MSPSNVSLSPLSILLCYSCGLLETYSIHSGAQMCESCIGYIRQDLTKVCPGELVPGTKSTCDELYVSLHFYITSVLRVYKSGYRQSLVWKLVNI